MVISIILLSVSLACSALSCVVRLFDRLKISIFDAVCVQIALIVMVVLPEIDYTGQLLKVAAFAILLLVITLYVVKVKSVQIVPFVLSCAVQILCGVIGCYSVPIGGIAAAAAIFAVTMLCGNAKSVPLCCLCPAALWLMLCLIFSIEAFSSTVGTVVSSAVYALFTALPAVNLLRQNLRGDNA